MQEFPHICPMIWEDLSLKNDGDLRPCCHFSAKGKEETLPQENESGALGKNLNYRDSSYFESINHSRLKELRATFLAGKWPEGCVRCASAEKLGLSSMRVQRLERSRARGELESLLQRVEAHTSLDGHVDANQFPLREMDIRFNNHCNLRCRHCGPVSSSSWYSEAHKFGEVEVIEGGELLIQLEEVEGKVKATFDRSNWSEAVDFRSEKILDFQHIRRIYFAGGEPLLQKKHHEFLESLVEKNLSHRIELEYNTNLTYLPAAALQLWEKFQKVKVGISLDGVEEHFQYIRFPAKFSTVVENLKKLDQSADNIQVWISYTVNVLNVAHLPATYQWIFQQGFQKIGKKMNRPPVSLRMLNAPARLNIQNMPLSAKEWVKNCFERAKIEKISQWQIPLSQRQAVEESLEKIIQYMNSRSEAPHWPALWQDNVFLDGWRKQSFARLEPELSQLLDVGLQWKPEVPRALENADSFGVSTV